MRLRDVVIRAWVGEWDDHERSDSSKCCSSWESSLWSWIGWNPFFSRTRRDARLFNPDGDALLGQDLTVTGNVFLRDSFQAEGAVSLYSAEIGGQLDCTNGSFTTLDLREARIGSLHDNPATNWPDEGQFRLDGLTYTSISDVPGDTTDRERWLKDRLSWIQRQPEYAPQPYAELRDFLNRAGHEPEGRTVAIARQTDLRKLGHLPPASRLWSWFLGLTIAHGYRPCRPLAVGVLIVIIGAFIFSNAYADGLMIVRKPDVEEPAFNAWIYSLDTFVPIVNFTMQENWQPSGEGVEGKRVQWFYWSVIALGWIISTLLVLSFTDLVRKD